MPRRTLLQACVNGARHPSEHPRLEATPEAVAHEARAAVDAGAGAVHLHAKHPSGGDSIAAVDVAAYLDAARAACPGVPLGVTTGAWAVPSVDGRAAAIDEWTVLPDFVSLNWHEEGADRVADRVARRDVGIEAGIWHDEGLSAWARSAYRGSCLRVLIELPDARDAARIEATAHRLVHGVRTAEPAMPILLHGEGDTAWPALDLAVRWGLDARIGLEDTLRLPDGALAAGNAALVAAAVRRIEPGVPAGNRAEQIGPA